MATLHADGKNLGAIRARKAVEKSTIWLTQKRDATWWVVVKGPDYKIRIVGFIRPPQEKRARDTYDSLSKLHVLGSFLEGRDS